MTRAAVSHDAARVAEALVFDATDRVGRFKDLARDRLVNARRRRRRAIIVYSFDRLHADYERRRLHLGCNLAAAGCIAPAAAAMQLASDLGSALAAHDDVWGAGTLQ